MASHLEAALRQLRKARRASPKQAVVFSGHSNIAASRCLVQTLRLENCSAALKLKVEAVCTVFEAVGGIWFDSLPDSSHLPFLCALHSADGEKFTTLDIACLAPGGIYCTTDYEFPLAYLLLDANIQEDPHINSVLTTLSAENRKSVTGNLKKFHNALELLGSTPAEVYQIWLSVARALSLKNIQLSILIAHLKSTLQIDFAELSNDVPPSLNPFNDTSNPNLNVKRSHYFNAVEIITLIIQRAFRSKDASKKINSRMMLLVTSPTMTTSTEKAGPREFYHHYMSDRLLIQSILHELRARGENHLEIKETTLSSSGVFALLDEQLAAYRPVQNNYLRWIADAAVSQKEEMYRSFFHFNDAVSYKASDFSSFQKRTYYKKNEVEIFNKFECILWKMHKARFYYIHSGDHNNVQPAKSQIKYLNVFCDVRSCNCCPKFLKVRATVTSLTENAKRKHFVDGNAEAIDTIGRCVKEHRSLMTTTQIIADNRNISRFDEAFIEVNYVEKLLEAWIADAVNSCKLKYVGNVAKIVEEFENFKKFEYLQFPVQIRTLNTTKLLLQHKMLVSRKNMTSHIFQFKESVILHMLSLSEALQKEYALIISLKNFIRSQKCVQTICRKLALDDFFKERTTTVKNLRRHVDYLEETYAEDSHYHHLQTCLESITDDQEFTSMFKLIKMLKMYNQEVQFVENDNMLIVRGMCIQLSECISTIENYLKLGVAEVRIVCGDVLHFDSSLQGDVWQGINVVLLAKQIRIWDERKIDLSGKPCLKLLDDAGQAEDGSGNDGVDGYPGTSGGNALITAEEVIDQQHLEFISNGGAGGDGQKGGDGRDGHAGKAMKESEMRNNFDSYIKTNCKPGDLIWKQITSTSRRGDYKRFSSAKSPKPTPDDFLSFVEQVIDDTVNTIDDVIGDNGTGYINGTRQDDGLGLEFNYDHWAKPCLNKSNFFVCYGTNGTAGQLAGEGGLGGEGGFPGNLDACIQNIATTCNPGEDGREGVNGVDGCPGKNGWDIGYHDHNYWKSADYVGTKCNRKLKIVPTGKRRQHGLSWCKYLDNYVKLDSSALPSQVLKVCKVNVNKRIRLKKQNHATATRSKVISREEMERRYNQELHAGDRLFADIDAAQKMAAEMLERAMQSMALNKLQEDDLDIEVEEKVKRQANHVSEKKLKVRHISCTEISMVEPIKITDFSKASPQILPITELGFNDIQTAFQTFVNSKWTDEEQTFANDLLIHRYRVMQLQKIEKKIIAFVKELKQLLVTESDFLTVEKNAYKNENVSEFLFVDSDAHRKEAVEKLKETVEKNKKEDLKGMWPMIECLLNECKSPRYKNIQEKSMQWKAFQDNQSYKIALSFQNFQELLFLNVHCNNAWNKWKDGEISKKEFYNVLDAYEPIALAFERYESDVQEEFDFLCCISSQSFMMETYSFIQHAGFSMDTYFYLLQYLFDVNLQIYSSEKTLNIEASSTDKSTIILKKGKPCTPLKLNRELLNLVNTRLVKSTVAQTILMNSLSMKSFESLSMLNSSLDIRSLLKESKSTSIACRCQRNDIDIIMNIMHNSPFAGEIYNTLSLITTRHFESYPFLHTLATRLSYEPIFLNDEDLLFILNRIVETAFEDRFEIHWILSVSPIDQWLARITILSLENYFQSHMEEEILDYLNKSKCKEAIILFNKCLSAREYNVGVTKNVVMDIFRLLSIMQDGDIDVHNLELHSWPFALKTNYWKSKLGVINVGSTDTTVAIVNTLENKYGSRLVEELIALLGEKLLSSEEASYIFDAFYTEKWALRSWVLDILRAFSFQECLDVLNKSDSLSDNDKSFGELFEIISENSNSSDSIRNTLIEIKNIFNDMQNSVEIASAYSLSENQLLAAVKDCDLSKSNYSDHIKALAYVDRGIEIFKGFRLRDTQKLAVLVLLSTNSNVLLQVSTGEGKSLIVVAAAILKTLKNENVNIITSSTVLAKRDAECMSPLFGYFKVAVSHNCQAKVEDRREVYSKNRVIYGDVSGFQRDFLLDRFYDKNILGDRTFDNVIVDEVDSMLLDKGNNMLYLSHEICGLDKLQSLYVFIWKLINASGNDLTYLFDTGALKKAVLYDLFGLVQLEDLAKLCDKLTESDIQNLWIELQTAKIIDSYGKLLIEKPAEFKHIMLKESLRHLAPRIQYLINELLHRDLQIHVPKCFYKFIEQHLDSWLESAKNAFFLVEKQDYVVDVDRSGAHLGQNIVILDRNTGTDLTNSQWDEALHQFLQIKHGCKLTAQSLKGVFVSNVSYLQKYNHLCGLTGTLGSQPERELLKDIHAVEFLTIPHNKERKFKELPPLICEDRTEWVDKILEESQKIMLQKRSILIICDTVQDVNSVFKAMGGKKTSNVRTYTREYEDMDLTTGKRTLEPMMIIISTNLAGRGTDIILSNNLRENGGLHVCLTYLTSNSRIEEQALGRAARAGDHGSGRIICMKDCEIDQDANQQKIYSMTLKRDSEELRRLSEIKTFYEKQIKIEEACFEIFSHFYSDVKKNPFTEAIQEITGFGASLLDATKDSLGLFGEFLEDNLISHQKKVETVRDTIRNMVLKTHLDSWAFWLDKNSWRVKQLITLEEEEKFYDDLRQFLNEVGKQEWKTYVSVNPWIAMKLGKFLMATDNVKLAVELFSNVIQNEPNFSAFAQYYKAKALSKSINWKVASKRKEFEQLLLKSEKMLSMHNERLDCDAGIISNVRKEITSGIITVNAFEEQQSSQKLVHEIFLRNIAEFFGLQITPDALHSDSIDMKNAEKLFVALTDEGIINKVKISNEMVDENTYLEICDKFGMLSTGKLKVILKKYQERDFLENELIEEFKSLKLCSRELFWKELANIGILKHTVEVLVIDYAYLKEYNSELFEKVEYFSSKGQLKEFVKESEPIFDNKSYNVQLHKLNPDNTLDDGACKYRMYLRNDLASILGDTLVTELEKCDATSSNKFAHLHIESAKALKCWRNDLDLRYFAKYHIDKSEQDLILGYLVDSQVLHYVSGKYYLNNATTVSSLKPFPVYDSAIRSMLLQNFILKNTLDNLVVKIEKCEEIQSIALHSNPEKRLFFALIDAKIIDLTRVTDKDFDKKMLETIIWSIIPKKKPTQYEENIMEKTKGGLVKVLNYVNDENDDVNVNFIYGALKNYQNVLKRFEEPVAKLIHVAKFLDAEKEFDFSILLQSELNDEHEVISWDEAKWTFKIVSGALAVAVLGIAQIIIGVAIEFCTAGWGSQVGAAFISEGLSDIMYSIGALVSGRFTWADYKKQKLVSLTFTALTFGIAGFFSKGASASYFGRELMMPGAEVMCNGVLHKATDLAGRQLVTRNTVGLFATTALKRIGSKALEGVAYGLVSATVEKVIDNQLRSVCEFIARQTRQSVTQAIENHEVNITLNQLHTTFGSKKANEKIDKVTKHYFAKNEVLQQLTIKCKRCFDTVLNGLSEALNVSKDNKALKMTAKICKYLQWASIAGSVLKVTSVINDFYDKVNVALQLELGNHKGENYKGKSTETCEEFQMKVRDSWKGRIDQHVGDILADNVIAPVMNKLGNAGMRAVGRRIKSFYEQRRMKDHINKLDKMKSNYERENHTLLSLPDDEQQVRRKEVRKIYDESLMKLMKNTRDPKLFARIIREGGKIDAVGVRACIPVLEQLLNSKVAIIVENDDRSARHVHGDIENAEHSIHLKIGDNHYTLTGGIDTSTSEGNNCLLSALEAQLQSAGVTQATFRELLADKIETDVEISSLVSKGLHRYGISEGFIGGDRLNDFENKPYNVEKGTVYRFNDVKDVDNRNLMKKYLELAIKYSEKLGIDPKEMNDAGRAKVLLEQKLGSKLRKELIRINNDNLADSFNVAFDKAMERVDNVCKVLKLSPESMKDLKESVRARFEATNFDKIVMEDGKRSKVPGLYPTEMDANISVYSNSIAGEWRQYNFSLNLNLDNPAELDNGPSQPHIGYNLRPVKDFTVGSKVLELNKPKKVTKIVSVDVSDMEKHFTSDKCVKKGTNIHLRAGHVIINHGEHLPDRGRSMTKQEVDSNHDPEFKNYMLDAQKVFLTPVKDTQQIRRYETNSTSYYENDEKQRLAGRFVTKDDCDWKELDK